MDVAREQEAHREIWDEEDNTFDGWDDEGAVPTRALFPGAPEPWLDLSTGINPVPYPCPALPPSRLARLPSAEDDRRLRAAAAAALGAITAPAAALVATTDLGQKGKQYCGG